VYDTEKTKIKNEHETEKSRFKKPMILRRPRFRRRRVCCLEGWEGYYKEGDH